MAVISRDQLETRNAKPATHLVAEAAAVRAHALSGGKVMTSSAHGVGIFRFLSILLLSLETAWAQLVPPVDHAKQGTIMKVQLCNVGAFGKISYPPFWLAPSPPPESLGLEYPVAGFDPIEHVYGAGLWVGGLRDTSATGGGVPLRGGVCAAP